jgi:hypothetical protein
MGGGALSNAPGEDIILGKPSIKASPCRPDRVYLRTNDLG